MSLQTDLDEAKAAYHKLMTGSAVSVFVDQNGERVEYAAMNANKLAAYIANLERQLAASQFGPMKVWI